MAPVRGRNASASETGVTVDMQTRISGEAFLTPPGDLSALVAGAVTAETGHRAGVFDHGRHIGCPLSCANHCPVVEFGLVGHRMHEVDERVSIRDIHGLKQGLRPHPDKTTSAEGRWRFL